MTLLSKIGQRNELPTFPLLNRLVVPDNREGLLLDEAMTRSFF